MAIYAINQNTWNTIAQIYEERFMDLEIYNQSYDRFCAAIPKQAARVLEVGCGPGNISRYLLKQRPDFELLGIDCAPNMVDLARKNNPSARFQVMDARNLSELVRPFDGIISGFCLPYLLPEDGSKLLQDFYDLLEDKGLLYLSFVEGDSSNPVLQTGSSGDRTYFTYYELSTILDALTRIGFVSIETTHLPYTNSKQESETHTLLLARKSDRQSKG